MMKLFTKAESHYMTYEIAHIAAVNMVAALCHAWKPKYLIHDIEKPFMTFLFHNAKKASKWHRQHNRHHIEYKGKHDYEAMCIDWESARYTKAFSQLNCTQTIAWYILSNDLRTIEVLSGGICGDLVDPTDKTKYAFQMSMLGYWPIVKAAKKLGLWNKKEFQESMLKGKDYLDKIKNI